MQVATGRRLADELNISADLEFVYKFSYQARFDDTGSENELCSVFLGRCDDEVVANRTEIMAVRFVSASTLANELGSKPELFTPWFRMEWDRLRLEFRDRLSRYTAAAEKS
jgi:isopentenyl-diphosphate delta-isomerase